VPSLRRSTARRADATAAPRRLRALQHNPDACAPVADPGIAPPVEGQKQRPGAPWPIDGLRPAVVLCTLTVATLVLSACTPAAALAPVPTAGTVNVGVPAAPTPAVSAIARTPAAPSKTSGCVSQGGLPDPACTPGAVDPRVNQGDLNTTVCARGYTATVRPPVSVTEPIISFRSSWAVLLTWPTCGPRTTRN
jgi:hypothetical protein